MAGVLSSLADAGWAPTSASRALGVAAALAGRPPWAVGTAPFVSSCPCAPNILPAGAHSLGWGRRGAQPPLPHLCFSSQPSAPLAVGAASASLPTSAPARMESKGPPAQVTGGGQWLMGRTLRLHARHRALCPSMSSSTPIRQAFSFPFYRRGN